MARVGTVVYRGVTGLEEGIFKHALIHPTDGLKMAYK